MGYDKVRKKFEGKVFESKSSGKFKVIKYIDRNNILIEFLSTGYRKTTSNGCIKNGSIRDLWKTSVIGYGINDADYFVERKRDFGTGPWVCPIYARWVSMLKRCYDKVYLSKYPSYAGCTVCEDWLRFSNFREWVEKRHYEGLHLDKDIIGDGKTYSPENCIFIDPKVNTLITEANSIRGDFPLGVAKDRDKRVVKCRDPYLAKAVTIRYLREGECSYEVGHNLWKTYKQTIVVRMWLTGVINDTNIFEALMSKYSYKGDNYYLQNIVKKKLIKHGVDCSGVFELIDSYNREKFILPVDNL